MGFYVKLVLILIVIAVASSLSFKIIWEYNRLKKMIKCRSARLERGSYDLMNYVDEKGYYKDRVWLSQRNKGENPCKVKKPINIKSYSDECDYIIAKKGM